MFRILSLALVLGVGLLGSVQANGKKDKKDKKGKKPPHHAKVEKVHEKLKEHIKVHGNGKGKINIHEKINVRTKVKHTAHALVEKGKIRSVEVTRKGKDGKERSVATTKFKSKIRLHAALATPEEYHFISTADRRGKPKDKGAPAKDEVQSIGFGYFDDEDPAESHWEVLWFAPDLVEGGAEGAEDFEN